MPLSRATYIDLLFPTEQSWGVKGLAPGPRWWFRTVHNFNIKLNIQNIQSEFVIAVKNIKNVIKRCHDIRDTSHHQPYLLIFTNIYTFNMLMCDRTLMSAFRQLDIMEIKNKQNKIQHLHQWEIHKATTCYRRGVRV